MSFSWRSVFQLEATIIARRKYWVLLAGSLAPRVSAFLNFSGVAGFGSGLQSARIALYRVGWLATDGSKGHHVTRLFVSNAGAPHVQCRT